MILHNRVSFRLSQGVKKPTNDWGFGEIIIHVIAKTQCHENEIIQS